MKRNSLSVMVMMLILVSGWLAHSFAQETPAGAVTVPWDAFQKLLNLEEDALVIPLAAYQKLLAHTGSGTIAPQTVKGGQIVLTRAEFQQLIDKMKSPATAGIAPPFDFLITRATYAGEMDVATTAFTATFQVQVLKDNHYLKIPVLPQRIALQDIRIGDQPALVVSENGFHHVILTGAGAHRITATFSMKSSLEKGPHKLDLQIQPTPITLLKMTVPAKDIDIEIPQAQQLTSETRGNTTSVTAVIASGQAISFRWRKQIAAQEKIPAKLYSTVHHLVSIEDDVLKIRSDLAYTILHSEIDAVRLAIPDAVNILAITGEGVGEWQETTDGGQRIVNIPLSYGTKGGLHLHVVTEKPLSESGLNNSFTGVRTLGTVRETGFIGIELNTSAEVVVPESNGLEKVPPPKLPAALLNKSAKPLMLGFKYLKHPYHLMLDIRKHEKVAVPVAFISSANVVTLFTEDGKIVNRLIYQIRNSAKQFLEIQLPESADVWSVFVGNQAVESSLNSSGKLLVPLIRSRSVNNSLETFAVEVVYAQSHDGFSWLSRQEAQLPTVDLLTSQLIWSVYLPNDYDYLYFNSTLEKEEMIRGVNVFSRAKRQYNEKKMREVTTSEADEPQEMRRDRLQEAYAGKAYDSRFRNVPMAQDQLSGQVEAEVGFGGRMESIAKQDVSQSATGGVQGTGVLPIHIQVPTSGQVYRFARTIITPENPLTVSVVYSQSWLNSAFRYLLYLLAIAILYRLRGRLRGLMGPLRQYWTLVVSWLRDHRAGLQRRAASPMTPFVLVGLTAVAGFYSPFLTLALLFLVWVSMLYHIMLFFRRRRQGALAGPPADSSEGGEIPTIHSE